MYADKLDTLGKKLANTALTLLVPPSGSAHREHHGTRCRLRGDARQVRSVIDELIDDAKDAGVAHIAFQTAAWTLAHEGIQTLRQDANESREARQKELGFLFEQRLKCNRHQHQHRETTMTKQAAKTLDQQMQIALDHLFIETRNPQQRPDGLHEVSVWGVKNPLMAATKQTGQTH